MCGAAGHVGMAAGTLYQLKQERSEPATLEKTTKKLHKTMLLLFCMCMQAYL